MEVLRKNGRGGCVADGTPRPQPWGLAIVCGLLFLFGCGVIYAESTTTKEPIIEHLEFLGFECDRVEAG
ncbi:MAG: hypothetical protein OEY57_07065, partial [Nitrospirota bacterium]|nr:hypothetical protein [Nitrospirota bacterium]